ncbi:hypothetical protein CPB85DRAFT_1444450 [Mucidula mucida]|nr:hypothetical protein CPB85DRAFT_1444450 [Mucidula mucida]
MSAPNWTQPFPPASPLALPSADALDSRWETYLIALRSWEDARKRRSDSLCEAFFEAFSQSITSDPPISWMIWIKYHLKRESTTLRVRHIRKRLKYYGGDKARNTQARMDWHDYHTREAGSTYFQESFLARHNFVNPYNADPFNGSPTEALLKSAVRFAWDIVDRWKAERPELAPVTTACPKNPFQC